MKLFIRKTAVFCLMLLTVTFSINGCGKIATEKETVSSETVSSFQKIAGTWREKNEAGVKVLIIGEDGNYLLLYEVGVTVKGSVKIEKKEGEAESRFVFYDETDDIWAESASLSYDAKKDSSVLSLEGAEKAMRFQRVDMNQKTPAEDYIGTWQCGRCSVTIRACSVSPRTSGLHLFRHILPKSSLIHKVLPAVLASSGKKSDCAIRTRGDTEQALSKRGESYPVTIIWGSSAAEQTEWNYDCRYDADTATLICDGGATMEDTVYDENGRKTFSKKYYDDGSGSFKARGDILLWTDNKDHRGDDLIFVRLPIIK